MFVNRVQVRRGVRVRELDSEGSREQSLFLGGRAGVARYCGKETLQVMLSLLL